MTYITTDEDLDTFHASVSRSIAHMKPDKAFWHICGGRYTANRCEGDERSFDLRGQDEGEFLVAAGRWADVEAKLYEIRLTLG